MDDRLRESVPHRSEARERLQGWFQASPVELAGLCLLLLGAIVATAIVLWDVRQRPDELPPAGGVGEAVHLDEHGRAMPIPVPPDEPDLRSVAPTVHVSGAVRAPGVVTLAVGSRVHDAIAAAGGLSSTADPAQLNLARPVGDGEQIHVPAVGEVTTGPSTAPSTGTSSGMTSDGRVDLNRATIEELETLPGIGPAKAAAIVTHRETEGPFTAPGDLRAVPGIGERTFQQLAELVTVG